MKSIFNALQIVIRIIAVLLFFAGIVLTVLGGYDFVHVFTHLPGSDVVVAWVAIGLLQGVDLFLIAIVLFVFSLGILILFTPKAEQAASLNLPRWLKVQNFMELKVILWEAILTTLVISYLAGAARIRMAGHELKIESLLVPGAILLIAISLYFLKKGESHGHGTDKSEKMD